MDGSKMLNGPLGQGDPASIRSMVGAPMSGSGTAAPADPSVPGAPQPGGAPQAPQNMPSVEDLEAGLQKTVYLRNKFRDLLAGKKLPSRKQVLDLSTDLIDNGILSAPRIANELATLPQDQDGITKWVEQHFQKTDQQVDQILTLLHGTQEPEPDYNNAGTTVVPGPVINPRAMMA